MPMLSAANPEAVIPVNDLDEAVTFYGDKLGLEVIDRIDAIPESPSARLRAGDATVMLYKSAGAGESRHTLANFVVDDVERTVSELRDSGVRFEEYDMPGIRTEDGIAELGPISAAWFKDPDGNIISVGSYES